MIPESEWEWFGKVGHFLCGRWCRFHLCTRVGGVIVSTVGEYVHPRWGKGDERAEGRWLRANPRGEPIGGDHFYETMVFAAGERCTDAECGCDQVLGTDCGNNLDFWPANDAKTARANHMAACYKYAAEAKETTTDERHDTETD